MFKWFLKLELFKINWSPFDNHPLVAQGYHQKPLSPSHLWSSNFIVFQPPPKEKGTRITFWPARETELLCRRSQRGVSMTDDKQLDRYSGCEHGGGVLVGLYDSLARKVLLLKKNFPDDIWFGSSSVVTLTTWRVMLTLSPTYQQLPGNEMRRRGTPGTSVFKDQQQQGWRGCTHSNEVWCLKAAILRASCWRCRLTLLTSWWVGKSVLVSQENKWLQCVDELLEVL